MSASKLEELWAYRQPIEAALTAFLDEAPDLFGVELSDHSLKALTYLKEYCLRPGKRIRGSLAAFTYDTTAGSKHSKQAIEIGLVLELVQSYLLIIDDVMDNSPVRRGKPTVHELYLAEDGQVADRHEAEMLAINVGCLAQHMANLQLGRIDIPTEDLQRTFMRLHTNIGITGFGQLDDMYQKVDAEISEAEVLQKYTYKSSYYTFVNPLQLGFTMAGKADASWLDAAQAFGLPAGIAFQIHDDYLGVFGDANKLGKSSLDDIREGKFTVLVQYALAHSARDDVERLTTILGDPSAGDKDLYRVRDIFVKSGAKEYARKQAKRYAAEAKKVLQSGEIGNKKLSQTLHELVDYAMSREF